MISKTNGNPGKSSVKDQLPVEKDQIMSGQKYERTFSKDVEVRKNTRDAVLSGMGGGMGNDTFKKATSMPFQSQMVSGGKHSYLKPATVSGVNKKTVKRKGDKVNKTKLSK